MDYVTVYITSNINSFGTQRRFKKDTTMLDLKSKLELLTGASPSKMQLEARTCEGKFVKKLESDDLTLEAYEIVDDMKIHVVDLTNQFGEFEDTSSVPKFELSNDEYEKRAKSLRAFKQQNKLGQFNIGRSEEISAKKLQQEKEEEEIASKIPMGSRCEVRTTGQPPRRGTVMFVGQPSFQAGFWVGVKYDEPMGKNDGSVKGKRYFECLPKYGGFVKPTDVFVGDFPELDNMEEEL